MKRRYAIGGVFVVALAAAAFYSTPYIALYSIHRAIERNDAEAVSRFVDFPVLRENIREKVLAHMAQAVPPPGGGALGGLSQMLATTAANQMVDRMVSPAGVMMLMQGAGSLKQIPPLQQRQQMPQSPQTPQVPQQEDGTAATTPSQPADPIAVARSRARDVRVSYQGWSKVRVGVPLEPGGLIFRREGLWDWRLIAVELPQPGRV